MTEYACRVKRDAYMSRASSTAWRASMSGIRAYAEGVGTLNVGRMDCPTHGDVSAESWHASQCAETFFSPQSGFP